MASTELNYNRPAMALRWQEIESRFSAVQPITSSVDPMQRHSYASRQFEPIDLDQRKFLSRIRDLLEWSYGSRLPIRAGQRFTRRAPSAGGLYPTEIYVLLEGRPDWHVLYYSFEQHAFFPVRGVHAAQAARHLGLDHGFAEFVLVSVLWRSMQRYGARGYRYCLIDAAAVCFNLLSTSMQAGGGLDLAQNGLSADLEEYAGPFPSRGGRHCAQVSSSCRWDLTSAPSDSGKPAMCCPRIHNTRASAQSDTRTHSTVSPFNFAGRPVPQTRYFIGSDGPQHNATH